MSFKPRRCASRRSAASLHYCAMSEAPHPALLPTGMHDLLPPEAEIEAAVVAQLMATLRAHGYERVKPPLVEFEETLFSGAGAAMATSTFRMMDPVSHRMIGVRADMTPQIGRIAATRLGNAPRPLRLSYAGQVLRVRGSEIRPERQVGQVGAELIGAAEPDADVEAIAVAAATLAALDRLDLPGRARAERARLGAVLDGLAAAAPELKVTVDPVENRGFEYHTGISFTFFAGGSAAHGSFGELGRGGRYDAGDPAAPEPATGFTLYTDTILRALPEPLAPPRVLLPLGADRGRADALRAAGWVTVAALEPKGDWRAEASRLGCSHVLEGAIAVMVG